MLDPDKKLSDNRIYSIWEGMCQRCYNPNHQSYHRYGGRGIAMCDEWRNNSLAFIEWAYSNGFDFLFLLMYSP